MLTTLNLIVTALLAVLAGSLLIAWAVCAASARGERAYEETVMRQWREEHARLEAERRKAQGLTSYARRDDPESAA